MTRILASALVAVAALTGAASAMTPGNAQLEDALRTYAPEVSASQLTDQEAALIVAIAHSGDSASEKRSVIRSFVQ